MRYPCSIRGQACRPRARRFPHTVATPKGHGISLLLDTENMPLCNASVRSLPSQPLQATETAVTGTRDFYPRHGTARFFCTSLVRRLRPGFPR